MAYYETELAKLNERISAIEALIPEFKLAAHLAPSSSVLSGSDKYFREAVAAAKVSAEGDDVDPIDPDPVGSDDTALNVDPLAKSSGDLQDAGDWTQAGDGMDYPAPANVIISTEAEPAPEPEPSSADLDSLKDLISPEPKEGE